MPVEPVLSPTRYENRAPGVYTERLAPRPEGRVLTGVPAFLGDATPLEAQGQPTLRHLTLWAHFSSIFPVFRQMATWRTRCVGFSPMVERNVTCCPCRATTPSTALTEGLERLAVLDRIDLVCAPDIMRGDGPGPLPGTALALVLAMQQAVAQHCEACGDRLALLDAWPESRPGRR